MASATAFLLLLLADASVSRCLAAAQFSIEPLLLKLPANKLATSLNLGNRGEAAVTVQAELVSWDQSEGQDRYRPVDELVVSPPIFSIAPGATQVVRVGRLRKTTAPTDEIAYRLRLAEVPSDSDRQMGAVATVMQLSLPVFVSPASNREQPQLQIRVGARRGDDLRLTVSNDGHVHGKLTQLTLLQNGKPVAERSLNYYVLAGASRDLDWSGALKNAAVGAAELQVKLANHKILNLPLTITAGSSATPAD